MLQVRAHHEEIAGRSSMRLDLTWPVINSIYIADGIPDCKSIDLCHSDVNGHRFFWRNIPGKPGLEA
jgi:hypothetical protein